jgi:hypothetical protein
MPKQQKALLGVGTAENPAYAAFNLFTFNPILHLQGCKMKPFM